MTTSTSTPVLGELARARSSDGTQPISTVRVLNPDLHGVARGKDVPAGQFEAAAHSGLCFCAAVMGTDLRHTPVCGGATCIRVPPERGAATRLERARDGAANPYLAIAGALLAGADGLARGLDPPAPLEGDAYRAAPRQVGWPLPRTLEAALASLEADELLCGGLGAEIAQTFLAIKRYEIERHRAWVSDWEIAEYAQHL